MCKIDWNLLLEFVKVFLSWPVATIAIALIFIITFRAAISKWIETREFEGNFAGGTIKLSSGQSASIPSIKPLEETIREEGINNAHTPTPIDEIPEELRGEPNIIAIVDFAKQNPIQLVKDYLNLNQGYLFERIYNRTYGTQVGLLSYLAVTNKWVSIKEISNFYATYLNKGGNKNYTEDQYIMFLAAVNLITHENDGTDEKVMITKLGTKFVEYVQQNYTSEWVNKIF